ncbi:MAG: M28 family peptidase [Acidobacteriota bacterium]|nr:M28 family peptidase [Acidobacteriota bacterium]
MRIVKWIAAGALAACSIALAASAAIDSARYLDDVKYLASPEMKGRATGSPELEKAARWIEARFKEFGLKPVGKSYLQPFEVTTEAALGKRNELDITENGRRTMLKCPGDFVPFNFSASGKVSGGVVFAGYGITAPEYRYDDYEGLDVKGKIVVVLRHEPQENDDKSVFEGKILTRHAQFANKAANARMHGAAAVILVNDRANHPDAADALEKFGVAAGPNNAGIPFVQVKEALVEKWFTEAGRNLAQTEQGIDRDLKPESFAFSESVKVDATVDVTRAVKTVHNVAAYLPGETSEYVIIGAHYDHLGLGGQYSLAPSQTGTVHPGADDNASGTAGVIELARWFSKQPKQKRGVLFLAFAGEELGLLGSAYYADHPLLPLEQAVTMINLDMIGRMREKLYIGGSGSGTTLRPMLTAMLPKYDLKVDYSAGASEGSSDHTSFTSKQVPALFFFSGLHADYHKPSDTADKIDGAAAARLLALVGDVAGTLCAADGRPAFVKVAAPAGHTSSSGAGPVSGYGPYFGSVPEFGEETKGVKFADIREGSPASKAGFRAGDVMVEFDGKPIQNLQDFTYVLQGKKPGDVVKVKVLRNGEPIEATVTLTRRN